MMRLVRASGRWIAVLLLASVCVSLQAFALPLQEPVPSESPDQPQQQEPDAQTSPPQQPNTGPRAAVHGLVKNSATGEPLPRALVRIEGDATSGSLTDGEGRFEIAAVPIGPQAFQVLKPGFHDDVAIPGVSNKFVAMQRSHNEHNVMVAADMPEIIFSMAPNNSIRGQIELSTGEPAQSIGVMLLRRAVQEGRSVWQAATAARTNSDGVYRFAGLADGEYALYTEPAMDSDMTGYTVAAGSDAQVARSGFGSLFYPDAHDLAGAAKIALSGGQQMQANLSLPLEPFHMVRATVVLPSGRKSAADRDGMNYTGVISDAMGHQLSYVAQYDQATHTVQAMLPDGTYSMLVTAVNSRQAVTLGVSGRYSVPGGSGGSPLTGQVEFSVAGHPISTLRVPLVGQQTNPVQVSVMHSGTPTPSNGATNDQVFITLSQAGGWITDGMVSTFAEGSISSGALETSFMAPGSYWVHTNISQRGTCLASFTAGGASLAREPLVLGISGTSAPLTLALRDDCADLKLSLPGTVGTPYFGEEPFYTVYVVPDFDSTTDVTPLTLRPSSGGVLTLDNMTPGNYHVYTFTAPVELEYRNPDALAEFRGQALTLTPGETNNLLIEVPEH
jgi:hypothetical protein